MLWQYYITIGQTKYKKCCFLKLGLAYKIATENNSTLVDPFDEHSLFGSDDEVD